jgi:hypothetical protein
MSDTDNLDSDSSDYSYSSDELYEPGHAGTVVGYQFEPEWTAEELAEQEHEEQLQIQQFENAHIVDPDELHELQFVQPVPLDELEHEDRTRIAVEQWCECTNCVTMPTNIECDCCKDVNMVVTKMEEAGGGVGCITDHPDFVPVCLNAAVLKTMMARLHYAYIERQELQDGTPTNR